MLPVAFLVAVLLSFMSHFLFSKPESFLYGHYMQGRGKNGLISADVKPGYGPHNNTACQSESIRIVACL